MAGDLWNIFLNVVAAIIYAGLVWLWNRRKNILPSKNESPERPPQLTSKKPLDNNRALNRQKALSALSDFIFYFLTFSVLYFSITMPLLFKALFSKHEIVLSQARFVGAYLPDISVGKDYLQLSFFIVATFLYSLLFYLTNLLAFLFHPVVDIFVKVTLKIHRLISFILFLICCVPISATSIWLFYEKPYKHCLIMVVIAMLFLFAIGASQERK